MPPRPINRILLIARNEQEKRTVADPSYEDFGPPGKSDYRSNFSTGVSLPKKLPLSSISPSAPSIPRRAASSTSSENC